MSQSQIEKIKKLRAETGVSVTLCKKALEESSDDLVGAKKILEKWGMEKSSTSSSKKTEEGAIFSYIHHNGKVGALVEVLCETDFVARNEEFQKLGHEIVMQISFLNPKNLDELLKSQYIRDQNKTLEIFIQDHILKIGENIKIGRFERYEL